MQISKYDLTVISSSGRKMKLIWRVGRSCKIEKMWMFILVLSCLLLTNTKIKNKRRSTNFLMRVRHTIEIFKIQHRRQRLVRTTNTLQISLDKKIGKRCWKISIRLLKLLNWVRRLWPPLLVWEALSFKKLFFVNNQCSKK